MAEPQERSGLPEKPTSTRIAFVYGGAEVTFDADRMINLTEMWRAAGSDESRRPMQWRRFEGASFVKHRTSVDNMSVTHIFRSERGRKGSTWAHWQIALAYAKYLSPEFHSFVNDAFREWAEEQVDPGLKAERAIARFRRLDRDDRWIEGRILGIFKRNALTDTLKEFGVHDEGYASCTDAMNREVLGGTAKEIRLARGLGAGAQTRDYLSSLELAAILFAETMAEHLVRTGCAQGNRQCSQVCRKAAKATYEAMASMGLAPDRDQPQARPDGAATPNPTPPPSP